MYYLIILKKYFITCLISIFRLIAILLECTIFTFLLLMKIWYCKKMSFNITFNFLIHDCQHFLVKSMVSITKTRWLEYNKIFHFCIESKNIFSFNFDINTLHWQVLLRTHSQTAKRISYCINYSFKPVSVRY